MSQESPDPSTCERPTEEEKRLIEMQYGISIDDIRQLKNRQWDVTKWVLAANVALFIPIAIKRQDLSTGLPADILQAIALLSFFLAVLAAASILKTQWSLKVTRERMESHRNRHGPAFVAADACGKPEKKRHKSYWYDGWVWVPMLAISLISSSVTICAAWPNVLPICACLLS